MSMLDVFNSDFFTLHSLTESVNKLPYMPGRVGKLGLFEQKPATTDVAFIEEQQGQLSLLMTAKRGSQGQNTLGNTTRKMTPFLIPHVPIFRELLAKDIEGKRAFGSEDQTEVVSQIVNDLLQEMKDAHAVTHEYHRLGALKGIVLDGDGSTEIVNFFTTFGITQTNINFVMYDTGTYDAANPAQFTQIFCNQIIRAIRNALGATPFSGVHALCGDNYFDRLINHAAVRRTYENWTAAKTLQTSQIGEGNVFPFGGIDWENYRGSVGSVDFIDTNEAVIFPKGTRGVFKEVPAPADFMETVNQRGQMIYAKQERMKFDKGVELHTQSNVLYLCTRPACLISSSLSNNAAGT